MTLTTTSRGMYSVQFWVMPVTSLSAALALAVALDRDPYMRAITIMVRVPERITDLFWRPFASPR